MDRNTIKVRLPDELLYKLVKLQVNSAACKNKGFILDGYPRNINDAKNIFLQKNESESSVEDSKVSDFEGYTVKEDIIPQYVIVLAADDAYLK